MNDDEEKCPHARIATADQCDCWDCCDCGDMYSCAAHTTDPGSSGVTVRLEAIDEAGRSGRLTRLVAGEDQGLREVTNAVHAEQERTEARRHRELADHAAAILKSCARGVGLDDVAVMVADKAGRVAAVSTGRCQPDHARVAWAYLHATGGVAVDRPMTEREFTRAASMLSRLRDDDDPDSVLIVDALVTAVKKEPADG